MVSLGALNERMIFKKEFETGHLKLAKEICGND
jgi:hypothetical protein